MIINHDIDKYSLYKDYLVDNIDNTKDNSNNVILPMITNNGKKRQDNNNNEDVFISNPYEYWMYMYSEQDIDNRKYGLLYFIHYILKCFDNRDIDHDNNEYTNIRMEIRIHLKKMVTELINIENIENNMEKKGKDGFMDKVFDRSLDRPIDKNELKMMICECLLLLPYENMSTIGQNINIRGEVDQTAIKESIDKNNDILNEHDKGRNNTNNDVIVQDNKMGEEDLERQCKSKLWMYIRKYLIEKRISFEQLFNYLILTHTTDYINHAKNILNIDKLDKTIDILVALQMRGPKKSMNSVDINDLLKEKSTLQDFARMLVNIEYSELKVYKQDEINVHFTSHLRDKVHNYLKPSEMKDKSYKGSDKLRSSYEKFVSDYAMHFLEKKGYDNELNYWTNKVQMKIESENTTKDKLDFLRSLQKVFIQSENTLFLLRTLRITLSKSYPKLKGDSFNENEDSEQENIEKYRKIQNLFDAAEVPILCLSVIKDQHDHMLVDEASNILCSLLKLGNSKIQKGIFMAFEENIFTQGFFSYIKDRLKSSIISIKDEINRPLNERSILEMEDRLIIQRFRGISNRRMIINLITVLKYFCDNCYIDFQNFLRDQRTNKLKFNLHSINMLDDISDFLVGLTKDNMDDLYGSISELVEVILNVLTEFVLGPCQENQRVIIENKKIFDVINKILEVNLNEGVNKDLKISRIKILHQTAIFLESLVTGNEDQRLLGLFVESLNRDFLANQLLKIYISKVMDKKKYLFLDKYCSLVEDGDNDDNESIDDDINAPNQNPEKIPTSTRCLLDSCKEGKIAYYDLMVVNTGFKIFLIVKQLEDKMENHRSLEILGIQKVTDTPAFNQIRKKYKLYDFQEYNPNPNDVKNLNIEIYTNNPSQTMNSNKVSPSPSQKNNSQKNEGGDNKNSENFKEFIDNEKKIYFNEARKFFSSYVASLEINYRANIEKVHYQIPYRCRYISSSIKNSIIREVNRNSDQERIESFFFKVRYYEYEMVKRQGLSEYTILYYLTTNWKALKYFNYLLIIILNILMTIYINKYDNNENIKNTRVYLLYRIISYIQVFISFILLILTAYDRHPVILYSSSKDDYFLKERERLKNTKFDEKTRIDIELKKNIRHESMRKRSSTFNKIYTIVTDITNIYNLILFIISILSTIWFNLLYGVLLLDIVSISRSLSKILTALLKNIKLMILTCILCVLLLYLYSVIGFIWFSDDYIHKVYIV